MIHLGTKVLGELANINARYPSRAFMETFQKNRQKLNVCLCMLEVKITIQFFLTFKVEL